MNLTYIARVSPDLPCTILFDEEEWKVLYCVANRTKEAPEKPYSIAEAVEHIGNLGGPRRSPQRRPARCKNCLAGSAPPSFRLNLTRNSTGILVSKRKLASTSGRDAMIKACGYLVWCRSSEGQLPVVSLAGANN
jgi:hypothetical protein